MNKTAFAGGRLAAIDPDAVFEAAGVVRNAPTTAESTPGALQSLPPGEWESTEWGSTSAPKSARDEDELRHVHAYGDANVAFLPLEDTRLSRPLDQLIARRGPSLTNHPRARYAKPHTASLAKDSAPNQPTAPPTTTLTT